jgi:hypothetical protein
MWKKTFITRKQNTKQKNKYLLFAIPLIITIIFLTCFLTSMGQPLVESTSIGEQVNAYEINTATSLSPEQEFHCDIIYAYVGKGNSSIVTANNGIEEHQYSQYPTAVYFNFTHISDPKNEVCDVKVEIYLIQIVSNKGPTEKYIWLEGTNHNPSFSDFNKTQLTIAKNVDKLIDRRTVDGQGGHFKFNWTLGTSILGGCAGSIGMYTDAPSNQGLWRNGKPDAVSVDISVLGWITLNGDSVSISPNSQKDAKVTQISFQTYGDGFIINKIVPTDQLSKIDDLFNPKVDVKLR